MRIETPRWWTVILIVLAIPLLGFWLGNDRVSSRNAEANEVFGVPMVTVCEEGKAMGDSRLDAVCRAFGTSVFLKNLSLATGLLGLALVLGSALLAAWAGANRVRNARVFPLSIPVSLIGIGVLTLMQVVTVLVGAYVFGFLSSYAIILAIAGLAAALGLFGSLRALGKGLEFPELALAVPPSEESRIWGLVKQVATKVGAKVPDNLIVGLRPVFYASTAAIHVPGNREALKGETVYLSLPMLRLLGDGELRGVIGHELGHFSGQDLAYTTRFAPMYRALGASLDSLERLSSHWLHRLARLPALELTSFLLSLFAVNERRISRDREFEADRVGATASSAEELGSALVKFGVVARRWNELRASVVQDARVTPITNFSDSLAAKARTALAYTVATAAASFGEEPESHPTDTHPSTADRLEALVVEPASLSKWLSDDGWAVQAGAENEVAEFEQNITRLEAVLAKALHERGPR